MTQTQNATSPAAHLARLNEIGRLDLGSLTDFALTNLWAELDNMIDQMAGNADYQASTLPRRAAHLKGEVERHQPRD